MKKICLFVFGFLCFTSIEAQVEVFDIFSSKFKLDSMGLQGFRNEFVVQNLSHDSVFVNGLCLLGYSKEWVLKYLGKPNREHTDSDAFPDVGEPQYNYSYTIESTHTGFKELLIMFDENNKVSSLWEKHFIYPKPY